MHRNGLENIAQLSRSYADELLQALRRSADRSGAKLYLVGGTVRDCLLGRVSHDLDLAVSGSAVPVAKILQRELGEGTLVDLSSPDEETIRLVWRGEQIDISSFRAGVQTIEEDLHLRDFTINAMALQFAKLTEDGRDWTLIDPTGGLDDLRQGRMRHCPGAFVADPVRMLRGYRLCATLGFRLQETTRESIGRHAPLIDNIAAERISYELQLIFDSSRTTETLREMERNRAIAPAPAGTLPGGGRGPAGIPSLRCLRPLFPCSADDGDHYCRAGPFFSRSWLSESPITSKKRGWFDA